jgi:hypothetical protein
VRPLIIALVVSVCNRRDGRVATFRPIPQSVSGVGVRFSIGDNIRNLGEKSFCLTRRKKKFFILLRCCNIIVLSLFSRNCESDLSSETLWRSCHEPSGILEEVSGAKTRSECRRLYLWLENKVNCCVEKKSSDYPCRKGGVMETFMSDFIVVSIL